MVAFANTAYLAGKRAHTGTRLLAAIQDRVPDFSPRGRRRLPRFYRALRGWSIMTPSFGRLAYPRPVCSAMVVSFLRIKEPLIAVFTALMLTCYLRPSSALRLRRKDMIPPMAGTSDHWSLLVAPSEKNAPTKVGTFDQSVVVYCRWLTCLPRPLAALKDSGPADTIPWGFEYGQYSASFRSLASECCMALVPYQCRHSGPSIDVAGGWRTLLEVQKRGHWKSYSSVKT